VWEDARHAYLHEVLVRRVGCAAALAVVFADVMQRLLAAGAVDFAVRIDCSDLAALPTAEVRGSSIQGVPSLALVTRWRGLAVLVPVEAIVRI